MKKKKKEKKIGFKDYDVMMIMMMSSVWGTWGDLGWGDVIGRIFSFLSLFFSLSSSAISTIAAAAAATTTAAVPAPAATTTTAAFSLDPAAFTSFFPSFLFFSSSFF